MANRRSDDEISCMGRRINQDDDSVSQASEITLKTYVSRRQIPVGNHTAPPQAQVQPSQQPSPPPKSIQQPKPVQAQVQPSQQPKPAQVHADDAKTEIESMLHSRVGARGPHWTRWVRTARSDLYIVPKGHPFLPKEVIHLYTGTNPLDVSPEKWISLDDYNTQYKAYRQIKNDEPANQIKQRLSQKINEATQIEAKQQAALPPKRAEPIKYRQPVNIEPEYQEPAPMPRQPTMPRQPVNIEPDRQSRRSARQPANIEPIDIEPDRQSRRSARQPVNTEPEYQEPAPMRQPAYRQPTMHHHPAYRQPTLYEPEMDPDAMAVALPARHSSQHRAMQSYIPNEYDMPVRQSVPSGVGTMSLSRGSAGRASHLQIYGTDIDYEHKDADGSTFKIRVKNN